MLQSLASLDFNRELASQYHEGQFSAMYAFASTGTVLPSLHREILRAARDTKFKEYTKLMNFYVSISESPTIESVGTIAEFWHRTAKDSRGLPLRVRANGNLKTWKTRPTEFRLPVKYGLKRCFYITPLNVNEWVAAA